MKVQEVIVYEEGPASKALCKSKKPDHALGASQLASCKSKGSRKRSGKKSYKIDINLVRVYFGLAHMVRSLYAAGTASRIRA